jgi:hypothetical protein
VLAAGCFVASVYGASQAIVAVHRRSFALSSLGVAEIIDAGIVGIANNVFISTGSVG